MVRQKQYGGFQKVILLDIASIINGKRIKHCQGRPIQRRPCYCPQCRKYHITKWKTNEFNAYIDRQEQVTHILMVVDPVSSGRLYLCTIGWLSSGISLPRMRKFIEHFIIFRLRCI